MGTVRGISIPGRLRRLCGRTGKRGQALIIVAGGMMAFLGFGGLAIDVAMMYTAQNQLKQALDFAAIRAAAELGTRPSDLELEDLVRQTLAINPILDDTLTEWTLDVSGTPSSRSAADTVTVWGRYEMMPFFMALFPSIDRIDVVAEAQAKLVSVTSAYCFIPYVLPDRFIDVAGDSLYDPAQDIYTVFGTGYNGALEVGDTLTIGYQDLEINAHLRRVWGVDYDGTGGEIFPDEPFLCHSGDLEIGIDTVLRLINRPDGILGLKASNRIAKDPSARWDPVRLRVYNSNYSQYESPRIVKVPVSHPLSQNGRVMVRKLMSVFINQTFGDQVEVITMNILKYGDVAQAADDHLSYIKSARLIR
jgi:Flp pilus assembly protein TadG